MDNKVYETGAQRSKDVEHFRYDLFHPIFMRRVASVLAEGAEKYGEHNWEQGFPMNSLFNHLLVHVFEYLGGDRREDHLGHMACNIMFLIVESEMRYERNLSHLRGPNCLLTDEMRAEIERFRAEKAELKKFKEHEDDLEYILQELTLTGTLRESKGNLAVSELHSKFFAKFGYEELLKVLNKQGFTISEGCVQGVELDRGMVARTLCCKRGSTQSVEIVDHLIKVLQGGAYVLEQGSSVELLDLEKALGKPFAYEELSTALEAYGLQLYQGRVHGMLCIAAKEDSDINRVVKTLFESTITRDVRSSINLCNLMEVVPGHVDPTELIKYLKGTCGCRVTYISEEQDHIIFGIAYRRPLVEKE